MKKSYLIALITAIAVVVWVGSGVITKPSQKEANNQSHLNTQNKNTTKTLIDVRVETLNAQPLRKKISVTGRSQSSKIVDLKAEVDGEVTELLFEEGSFVEKNDLLLKLDKRDRQALVNEAYKLVEQRKIQYDAAKKLEDKGFNSKVRLAEAVAQLESAKAQLKSAQLDLKNTEIKAPFSGFLNQQYAEKGQFIRVGDNLFNLVQLSPIEFVGFVTEKQVLSLKKGQEAVIELLNGKKINGIVTFVAAAANPETRTFRVVITANNDNHEIADGLTAKIKLSLEQVSGYQIPASTLTLDGQGQVGVKIIDDQNKVKFMPVNILGDEGGIVNVTNLPSTIRLITVGQDFVVDGQDVNPVELTQSQTNKTSTQSPTLLMDKQVQ